MESPRELGAEHGKAVFVGIFGKHPGWNDHIEETEQVPDLGLRTNSLVWAKSLLYTQGIGRNIESGAWEKLPPGQALERFDHIFVWKRGSAYVAGSLWSSVDGKGRKLYPMVIAAHVVGMNLYWVLTVLLPRLSVLQTECQQTREAGQVGAALARCGNDLQQIIQWPSRSVPAVRELFGRFARHPQFAPEQEGLLRILSRLQAQASSFAPGRFNHHNVLCARGQSIRVPAAASNVEEIFRAWREALRPCIDSEAPTLFLWPKNGAWLDIIIGEPGPEDFFCLKATPARLPCLSEIPFQLDDARRGETRARLEAMLRGEMPSVAGSKFSRWLGALFKD